MTQKNSHPPALVRVRDNQRRSRARRKEYLEDLEARLARFEQLGVQANVEIQGAARKVARENTLLKELLEENGVRGEVVEEYLRTGGQPTRATVASETTLRQESRRIGSGVASRLPPSISGQALDTSARDDTVMAEHDDTDGQTPSVAVQSTPLSSKPARTLNETASSKPGNNLCRPRPVDTTRQHHSLDDVTSCEVAANIIASMRGHGDEEEARAELGCSPTDSCVVGNMTVFELLDR